ncbi:MAG: hypothetical protein CFE21_05735 [Bacteroidetes bacterium B1(2017)]|nr:MAG: hypothetical protein CFE21_05735 [Bacteroidetes bacterium B1(2017)]
MLLYLLFNTHSFQNYLVNRVSKYVNDTYHTRISIGEISYDGWSFFSLREVNFGDQKQDTTFYAGRLQFNLSGLQIDSTHFILNDVVLDEGLCKMTTYKDGTYSFDVINLFSNPNDTVSDPNSPPFILEFRNLECMDTRFMLVDSAAEFFPKGFDYNRICFSDINFRSKLFRIIDDSLSFDIKSFCARERSGFEITRLKANAIICKKTIELRNMDLVTPYSHLKNYFSLNSNSWDDYSDFLDKVILKGTLDQSEVDMKDIAYFVPEFEVYTYKAKVSGNGKGPISNLTLKNMVVSMGAETKFNGNVKLRGLPNIEETFMDFQVDYASTIRKDLEKIIDMPLPQEFEDLGKIVYRGNYTGFYKDFVTYGDIETAFGSAKTDLNMKVNEKTMLSEYSGNIKMNAFQLGSYLKNSSLGVIDLDANINGRGFDLATINTKFEANVATIGINNYEYHNLELKGAIANKDLRMQFDVADTNLELTSNVRIDLSKEFDHLVLSGKLENANLKQLHFHPDRISMGTDFEADYYFKNLNDHYGTMMIEDFHYEKAGYSYRVNQLSLETENGEEEQISLNGDFVHAKIRGEFDFSTLYAELEYWTLSIGQKYFKPRTVKTSLQNFDFDLNVLSTASISPLFFPGFNATNVDLEGSVNSSHAAYELAGYIGNVNYDGWHLNQTTFKINEENKDQGAIIFGFKNFGKIDTLLIGEFALKATAFQDSVKLQYQIQDSQSVVTGNFKHDILFEANSFWINYEPSWIQAGVSRWDILEGKSIELNTEKVLFENLKLENGEQKITIDGYYPIVGRNKNLSAKIESFELNSINQFAKDLGVSLGGLANGYVVYKNMGSREVVIANIKATDFALDKDTIGDYLVDIGYREKEEDLLIAFNSSKGKITNLKGSGVYDISRRNLNLDINFDDSRISAFQAFVKDYVKLYDGNASLNAQLSGPLDKLSINGQLQLSDVALRVEYLQTKYTLKKGLLNFNDNQIKIVPFNVKDANNQTARVSGQIKHNGFSNLNYDIHIDEFKSFQVMNTTARDNDLFYGSAYATGDFTMKGSSNDVAMYINATSEKGTRIIINPFGASSETGESYIHFISYDTLQTYSGKGKASDFGMGVYLNLKVNPNAEVQVIFDAKSDDRIKAKGIAKLKMDYLPDGNFLMYGNYELTEGEYRFSAMNVVAKKFDLKPGSTIDWFGDPLTGRMSISGIYKLKTTISPIVNMQTAPDPNVRVPVECIINIKGLVEKPEFAFDLNFPDITTNVTGTAVAELNSVVANFRRDPEMMNQQMLFLLISGGFVPISNSNNTASNSFGNQTVSDLLSKQAAGLIGKAVPNIDVSVDLLNASDPTKGRTILLSASKQFMDNRLEVQTSYAIDQTQTNFSATYKIKKNGSTKLKVFNKSGFDALYNRNVITSGTGLFYRKEFNDFSEIFKKQSNLNY